jgi:hypothetical protein
MIMVADPTVLYPMITFSGVLYTRSAVPAYLRWMQTGSITNHCFYALLGHQADALPEQVSRGVPSLLPTSWLLHALLTRMLLPGKGRCPGFLSGGPIQERPAYVGPGGNYSHRLLLYIPQVDPDHHILLA